ncbi:hypothetical protein BC831DRAFT_469002 [Entophlyctis helioformis]|nr:hypothetical protein BC831DRAFT_469002 [Entophlyctis helioformis]
MRFLWASAAVLVALLAPSTVRAETALAAPAHAGTSAAGPSGPSVPSVLPVLPVVGTPAQTASPSSAVGRNARIVARAVDEAADTAAAAAAAAKAQAQAAASKAGAAKADPRAKPAAPAAGSGAGPGAAPADAATPQPPPQGAIIAAEHLNQLKEERMREQQTAKEQGTKLQPSAHHGGQRRQLPTLEQVVKHEESRIGRPLTDEEKREIANTLKYLKEHEGHEAQHAEMALIMMGSLLVSQIGIMLWKKYHVRSYNVATLLGLWIVPMLMGLNAGNYRYVIFWFVFSAVNTYIVTLALESPMKSTTPKLVYRWYSWVTHVSYLVGIAGGVVMFLAMFHIPGIFGVSLEGEAGVFEFGIIVLFYGLYFGTLGRDFVDRLADRMAMAMGYYSRTGFPRKHLRDHMCAICGESTIKSNEPIHTLNCNHTYHEQCIRGWTIIGKKDSCPYCKEKVDLNDFKKNPWDTTQQMYLGLLDTLRYLLVWNPIVFIVIHVLFKIFGLK